MKAQGVRRMLLALIIPTIGLLAAGAAAQSSNSTPPESWPPKAAQYRFHMIGNSHIDAVWLWTWPEGMSAVVSAFRSAL